ncbi:unnamed protein product (macronuclear) [Paramecium tetraurelia]|uniref:Uncharacterized protein n=1 Tax=Paramecium tetraurelia TaxID=5888 RepID=A0DH49_PARTE|nr:uncharacterized protein GSPATT00016752001 [Paramecium tetraurelia]CAK82366.1 unnamed protein product [Paramecium tetraurelia]|eukprot:XP_001449763.1 hypothetical protein (macronuclear) [Paramecium tetraurelia strain d4-2]
MKSALLVVVLIACIQATTVSELKERLSGYGDHPFGSSMINLVSVNMKTGGSLNELKQLLQQIKDELIALTQLQDQESATFTRRSQVDLAKLQATLEQAQQDLDNQRQEQSSLTNELSTLQTRVKEDQAALDRNGRGSGDAQGRLDAENTDFAAKFQDYSDAILACKEAQRLLLNLRGEGASLIQLTQDTKSNLIQTKENFQKIKEILEAHTKKSSLTLFQPIIEGLAEMTTKVNPETLNNVLSLVARLITALQEGQDQLEANHKTQVENLTRLGDDLRNEKQTLQVSLATANNRLKEIQSRLNELDGLINISNAIVEVTQLNIQDATKINELEDQEYSNQKVSRQTEIDIVDRLIEYINQKLSE